MSQEIEAGEVRLALFQYQALVRECLVRTLESAGFRVIAEAGDPSDFVQRVEQLRPDVALVDLHVRPEELLPILERLHQTHPDVPLLALADDASGGVVDRCFALGASGCLDKRYTSCESLVDAIRSVAKGASVFPAVSFESLLQRRPEPEPRTRVLGQLSGREREVLAYIAAGADNLKIASHLGISERTVKAHVSSLYRKLGQENRTQIALLARELGVRPPQNV